MQLRPYQMTIRDFIVDVPRCSIYAGMGLGKTVSTLSAIVALTLLDDVLPVLVLAPLRVARSVWPEEVRKWAHLRHLKVSVISGTAAERKAALHTPADIYCANYEILPWLVTALHGKWPFRMIVADESTKLKSFRLRQGGKRAQALAKFAHESARFVALTGTPAPNGLQDLWGQVWFLDRGERLGRAFQAFVSRWFRSVQVGADRHAVRLEPHPHSQAEIQDRLRDISLTVDPKDHFDLADPIVNVIEVDLPPAARETYLQMEREMFIELASGHEIEAFDAASRTVKCLQLASGAIYTDAKADGWQEIHAEKLDALEDVVEEAAGAPVLVAYHFKSDLARLLRRFPQGRPLDKNPATIREWNAGKIPLLFAHPASAGHGLNLADGGNILVMFSHWWDLEQYLQIVERIGPTRQLQAGYDRPVFIHHLVARGTVDDLVMKRRASKASVQQTLLDEMKRKGVK